ncbi:uncharacterized protein I206_103886 [Kwoniella pini CBS 10737]|uniref:Uncharacterized protein n=1 Tax=Kwoniella pini CBS 10737 TaxID=1296096 RepID=A0A1B9I381_9TREE|nr:uncharacterized protein I206_04541 [Kwoniella pini CBS 10737]OCF50010.1 hypothetical protein I206_04541 [Kwoniella pini CBS 10737]
MFVKALFGLLPFLSSALAVMMISPVASEGELCLTVKDKQAIAGAKVQLEPCLVEADSSISKSKYQQWNDINKNGEGLQQIVLANSGDKLCLDKGADDSEFGSGLTIENCGNPKPTPAQLWLYREQQWLMTSFDDESRWRCLDAELESTANDSQKDRNVKDVRTYTCGATSNQSWDIQ